MQECCINDGFGNIFKNLINYSKILKYKLTIIVIFAIFFNNESWLLLGLKLVKTGIELGLIPWNETYNNKAIL